MPEDKAMYQPGPMGWGLEFQTGGERLQLERQAHADLAGALPEVVNQRQPAKAVQHTERMEKIIHLQESEGIEDGFSFLHLERVALGDLLPHKPQLIGSCVASGGRIADVGRMLAEVFLLSETEDFLGSEYIGADNISPFAPWSYRWGRHFGNLNGNMDGSFCNEHIRGKLEKGLLPCSTPGLEYQDEWLPEPQNESEYRKWGASNTLVNKFSSATVWKLLETEAVTDANTGKDLITTHFKPMQICSNIGFAPQEIIQGWTFKGQPVWSYKMQGNWAHNMTVYGCVLVRGKWYVIIRNTWGNSHKNGDWFAIPIELFDRWLDSAECMTIGNIDLPDNQNPIPNLGG